jgi:hypothetical protein
MLEFIGFIIKLIFGGLLGGICNYKPDENDQNTTSMFTGAVIGIIATISISFANSIRDDNKSILIGIMVIASFVITKSILKEKNSKIGIREIFALIIGWFVGIGHILHGIVLVLFLIFFLSRFNENKNQETE